jgi:hypothetical protein
MNKKALTEADIRTKFVTPAILGENGSKWDVMTQVREEIYFTKGRVIVRGKTVRRGEAKKADYLLFYRPNLPIAVLEAKDNHHAVGAGMQQALAYAESPMMHLLLFDKCRRQPLVTWHFNFRLHHAGQRWFPPAAQERQPAFLTAPPCLFDNPQGLVGSRRREEALTFRQIGRRELRF